LPLKAQWWPGYWRVFLKRLQLLNVQRACEAALAMGQHLIRREHLGDFLSFSQAVVLRAGAPTPPSEPESKST
jgi:hypothetical protein